MNPRFFIFASLMMVLSISAFSRTTTASPTQSFSVTMTPNYTARTPSNYLFGNGTWSGTVHYTNHHTTLDSQITLTGAEPFTFFILKLTYFSGNGQVNGVYYWVAFTDSNGNAWSSLDSRVPTNAVAVALGLYDATNFHPPLQTMISDPEIGGDDAS